MRYWIPKANSSVSRRISGAFFPAPVSRCGCKWDTLPQLRQDRYRRSQYPAKKDSSPNHAAAHTQTQNQGVHNTMDQGYRRSPSGHACVQGAKLIQLCYFLGKIFLTNFLNLALLGNRISILKNIFLCQWNPLQTFTSALRTWGSASAAGQCRRLPPEYRAASGSRP